MIRMAQVDSRGIDDIKVIEINDHILVFYAGRDWTRIRDEHNWFDDGAMKLGIATYAIHRNNKAVIYDTFADVRQAARVRHYLENIGIEKFTVVLSHWHLDHIAGNEIYADCNLVSNTLTRELLLKHKPDIELGSLSGPPGINPLILPDITFENISRLYLDDLELELRHTNIHSVDGIIIYIPSDKILLAGDTLEDPITYIAEVENLAEHVKNLRRLKQLPINAILPNHGDPDVIEAGGYQTTLIDATINYITRLVARAHDAEFLKSSMKALLAEEFEKGWIHYYEPYNEVHSENLLKVHKHYNPN
jgi:cyclase